VGLPITCIHLAGLVELIFGEAREIKLQIERDFLVRMPGAAGPVKVEFRPYLQGWSPTGMNELVSLFRRDAATADAAPDSTFTLTFTNGANLRIDPDPQYEGWNLWWPNGQLGQPAGGGFV
jgi:hypothetical protein